MQRKRIRDERVTTNDFKNKEKIPTLWSASLKVDYILNTEIQYSAL